MRGFIVLLALWAAHAAETPAELSRLTAAYPEFLTVCDKPNVVCWKDGTEMPFDDGIAGKSFEEMLAHPCLKDQMAMPYPAGWPVPVPGDNCDPGRVRYEPFFRKMYGDNAEAVRRHLVNVRWLPAGSGKTVEFSRVNGAAAALEQAGDEIAALPAKTKSYVSNPIGTFNWRSIAGVDQRSMHSFGIAIDFQLPKGVQRYWRWEKGAEARGQEPGNRKSLGAVLQDERLGQIVRIFEKHGFIWGGKWFHYDTMHCEYRPELVGN